MFGAALTRARLARRADLASMPRVQRVDRIRLRVDRPIPRHLDLAPPVELDNGFTDIWGVATRVGVFDYEDPEKEDGIFREYRPADEVLSADSLESLKGVPFTIPTDAPGGSGASSGNGHPVDDVSIENARDLLHGVVLDVRVDGDLVWTKIRFMSRDALDAVRSGVVELSCGYDCRLEDRSGVSATHGRYDAIQREIRYNHLALVDAARAGKIARLKLDSGKPLRVQRTRITTMKTIKLTHDGKTREIPMYWGAAILEASEVAETARADKAAGKRADAIETVEVTLTGGDMDGTFVLPAEMVAQLMAPLTGGSAPAPDAEEAPVEEEEEEMVVPDKAAAISRGDVAKIVAIEIAKRDKVREDKARDRADVERAASGILGDGYAYGKADTWTIAADAISTQDPDRKSDAEALAKRAKTDARAQGELLSELRQAAKAHRDASDTTTEQRQAINDAGPAVSPISTRDAIRARQDARQRGLLQAPKSANA